MKPFDHARAEIRTRHAQENMNTPNLGPSGYWARIWKARRRTQRIAYGKALLADRRKAKALAENL